MIENEFIHVLIADDDMEVLRTYESQLDAETPTRSSLRLKLLGSELFDDTVPDQDRRPIRTTTCGQGAEAVGLARDAASHGRRFDVIILDIRMPPGISGVDAAARIRQFDTSVPIIFVTGYSDMQLDAINRRVPPPDRLRYFHKPVKLKQLANTINEVATLPECG